MKYTAGATRCRRRISDANELFAATLSGPLYTVEYLATHHGRAMQALLKAGVSWYRCACGKIFSDYREVFYCDVYWGGCGQRFCSEDCAKLQKYDDDHDRMSCSQCEGQTPK